MFNKNDALRKKHLLRTEAESLINSAIKANKDLGGPELERYNAILTELGDVQFRLDLHARNMPQPDGPTAVINVENGFTPKAKPGNSRMHELYNQANTEVRAAIDGVFTYLQTGRISANANLSPTSDGGLLIPSSVQVAMERDYAQFAPVVGVCRIFATDTGEKTTFPVLSDSESAVQLAPEASTGADATVSGDTPPTAITGPQLGAWKASSKPVYVPRELVVDSPINVVNEVVGALLARIIRFENLKYTKGVGTTEAAGFLHDATAYNAGSTSTVLDLDIALDLAYSLPQLYRPNGVYMASDSTIKTHQGNAE
jgi:HK97 family phage major capsid protein